MILLGCHVIQGTFQVVNLFLLHFGLRIKFIQLHTVGTGFILRLAESLLSSFKFRFKYSLIIQEVFGSSLKFVVIVSELVIVNLDFIIESFLFDSDFLQSLIPLPLHLELLTYDVMVSLKQLHQLIPLVLEAGSSKDPGLNA